MSGHLERVDGRKQLNTTNHLHPCADCNIAVMCHTPHDDSELWICPRPCGEDLRINGLTWDQWAELKFQDSPCPFCSGGKTEHYTTVVEGQWFALCKTLACLKNEGE